MNLSQTRAKTLVKILDRVTSSIAGVMMVNKYLKYLNPFRNKVRWYKNLNLECDADAEATRIALPILVEPTTITNTEKKHTMLLIN